MGNGLYVRKNGSRGTIQDVIIVVLEGDDGGLEWSDSGSSEIWIMILIFQDLRKQIELLYFKNWYIDYFGIGFYILLMILLFLSNIYFRIRFVKFF